MTNKDVMIIYHSLPTLKDLKGFKLAKTILLNSKKIENELISVIREMVKDKPEEEAEKIYTDIMKETSEITFITLGEEDIPYDITVEQYAILNNFIESK